ncbi:MAG: hypothetical protein SPL30_03885 [Succinivibrio sp.]|jgi:hypothetical protein|nr:hypothetical protein [Succinivibrio sp.]
MRFIMVYVAAFLAFLFFVGALSLGMILARRPLKTEDEATRAILGDLKCATCTSSLCGFAGSSGNHASAKCDAALKSIPHKEV